MFLLWLCVQLASGVDKGEVLLSDLLNGRPSESIIRVKLTVGFNDFTFDSQGMCETWTRVLADRSYIEVHRERNFGIRGELVIEFSGGDVWAGECGVLPNELQIVLRSADPTEGNWPTHFVNVGAIPDEEFQNAWHPVRNEVNDIPQPSD